MPVSRTIFLYTPEIALLVATWAPALASGAFDVRGAAVGLAAQVMTLTVLHFSFISHIFSRSKRLQVWSGPQTEDGSVCAGLARWIDACGASAFNQLDGTDPDKEAEVASTLSATFSLLEHDAGDPECPCPLASYAGSTSTKSGYAQVLMITFLIRLDAQVEARAIKIALAQLISRCLPVSADANAPHSLSSTREPHRYVALRTSRSTRLSRAHWRESTFRHANTCSRIRPSSRSWTSQSLFAGGILTCSIPHLPFSGRHAGLWKSTAARPIRTARALCCTLCLGCWCTRGPARRITCSGMRSAPGSSRASSRTTWWMRSIGPVGFEAGTLVGYGGDGGDPGLGGTGGVVECSIHISRRLGWRQERLLVTCGARATSSVPRLVLPAAHDEENSRASVRARHSQKDDAQAAAAFVEPHPLEPQPDPALPNELLSAVMEVLALRRLNARLLRFMLANKSDDLALGPRDARGPEKLALLARGYALAG